MRKRPFFLPDMATQPRSTLLNPVEQGRLLLASTPRSPAGEEVSYQSIARKKTLLDAVNYCIEVSGLDDKAIAISLGIDAGHFSNIRKGKAGSNFPLTKLDDLMTLCGNEIPLVWQALRRGKGVHLLEGEAERQLREERELRMEAEKKLQYLEGLYRARV
jgi:hypothetical protein